MGEKLNSKNGKWTDALQMVLVFVVFAVVLMMQLLKVSQGVFTIGFVGTVSSTHLIAGGFILFAVHKHYIS